MKNNKSLFSNIVKYILLLVIVVGGAVGLYSYMNTNSNESQVRQQVKQAQESKKKGQVCS